MTARIVVLLVFFALGYIVGFPAARWTRHDITSFHRPLWSGYGNREARRRGALVAYLLGGWPALLVALSWRRSALRAGLVEEREDLRTERTSRRDTLVDGTS
jgi:hypothetical protein